MGFRENLRNEMYYMDVTVKELSEKTGIPYNTILSYLNKYINSVPKADSAVKIAKVLNVSVEYLVSGQDTKISPQKKSNNKVIADLNVLPVDLRRMFESIIHSVADNYRDK